MAGMSKEEYLKRYLSNDTTKEKKKKKKIKAVKQSNVRIIDDDVDISMIPAASQSTVDDSEDEAPTVAEVVDERPQHVQRLEAYRKDERWKLVGKDKNMEETGLGSKDYGVITKGRSERQRHDSDSDPSPPRRKRHDSSDSDRGAASPPGRKQHHDSDCDQSPSRRRRHDSDSDTGCTVKGPTATDSSHRHSSSPAGDSKGRRKRRDSDESHLSPPRIRRGQGHDSDQSPPRKRRHDSESDQSPPRRQAKGKDTDLLPPRRQQKRRDSDSDQSPPRKKRHDSSDSDQSPPRKKKDETLDQSTTSRKSKNGNDRDQSSTRRKGHDSPDASFPPPQRRRKKRWDSPDHSPPRNRTVDSDGDQSPPRKRTADSDGDQSPPRKRRVDSDGDQSPPRRSAKKTEGAGTSNSSTKPNKTLGGAKAGLSSAAEMKKEAQKLRNKEEMMFNKINKDALGKEAKTVFRDKSGKRRNLAEEQQQEEEEAKKQAVEDLKYEEWGKGLKQKELREAKLADMVHEASKPLARYKDDQDLDQIMRDMDREGDPMAKFLKKKKTTTDPANEKPRYRGPAPPPNRYGIMPGYRWDGVDRSNGFEKQLFAKRSEQKAHKEDAYKWSIEDM